MYSASSEMSLLCVCVLFQRTVDSFVDYVLQLLRHQLLQPEQLSVSCIQLLESSLDSSSCTQLALIARSVMNNYLQTDSSQQVRQTFSDLSDVIHSLTNIKCDNVIRKIDDS